MANHVLYTRADGTEITLKLDSSRLVDLETHLGDSIQKKLAETEKLSVASVFLADALPGESYNERKKTALAIYDEMIGEGKTLRDYLELIQNVLASAGFMDAADLARQKESAAAREKLAQAVHEAEMREMTARAEKISKMYTEKEPEQETQPEEAAKELPTFGGTITIPVSEKATLN